MRSTTPGLDREMHASAPEGIAVIVGSTGGIGAALVDHLAETNRFKAIVELSRSGTPVLDLTDEASIEGAAQRLARMDGDVGLVIDATGFLSGDGMVPEKSIGQIDVAHMMRAFALNAIGPALLMKHFLPLFPATGRAVFASLSARVGSIEDNRLGGWHSYRASKAALNQVIRCAAVEMTRRTPAAICVALHPGTVDTPLSEPFSKSGLDVQSPELAAKRLLSVIERLTPEDSGGFFDQMGRAIPW